MKFVNREVGKMVAVLYSKSQQCFHLETVRDYLVENIEVAILNEEAEWKLIAIVEDDIDGHRYIEEFKAYKDSFQKLQCV